MLSFFPQILWLAPFSSTILRLGVGAAFLYAGYLLVLRRSDYARVCMPVIGTPPLWMISLSGIVTVLDGFTLLLGYGTQAAALLGAVIALKHLFLPKSFGALRPLPKSTCLMLFLMCLALVISGAGPLGFDLPL